MATDTEQLVVLLEARIKDFERNMQRASGTASREFGSIERRAEQSSRKMEATFGGMSSAIKSAFSNFAPGFLAGGVAGLISGETLRMIGQAVKGVADMADQAARVNVDVESFQALSFAAHQSGVETGKLEDLLQKFNVEIGQAVAKGGDLKKILDANGISITDANGKIRGTKELFYEIVNLIARARTQQEGMVIATAAFGRGAADAVPFLTQGADAIRAGEQAARDAGAVIDADLVQAAADFDDKWTAAWDAWSARGRSAILDVMTGLEAAFGRLDEFLKRWNVTREALRATGSGLPGLSDTELDALGSIIPSLSRQGDQLATINNLEAQRNDLVTKRTEIEKQIADAQAAGAAPIELDEYNDRLQLVNGQLDDMGEKLRRLGTLSAPTSTTPTAAGSPSAPATIIPDLGSGGATRSTAHHTRRAAVIHTEADALARLTATQRDENESLRLEAASMGKSAFEAARMRKEHELLAQAQRSGVTITDAVKASIAQLATEYGRSQQAIEDARLAQERSARSSDELVAAQYRAEQSSQQFGQAFSGAAKGFLTDLAHGVSATDALSKALENLADQILSMALDGLLAGLGQGSTATGGKMGMLGKLFGFRNGGVVRVPGFASGGRISGPGTSRSDSILARLSDGEFVVNAASTAKHRQLLEGINSGQLPGFAGGGSVSAPALGTGPASGASVNVSTTINVNAPGGTPQQNNDLAKKVAKEVENSVRGIVCRELRAQTRPGGLINR